MRRLLIAALTCWLGLSPALAGSMALLGAGKASGGGGGGYVGPGDLVSFFGWWGLRAYSSAKRGTHAISLCDNAGANCADVLTDATTGALSPPGTRGAVNCTTAGTCLITTFYDQTANGNNCTQATAANMAVLSMTTGPGGTTPAATFNGTSTVYDCTNTAQALPTSESAVAKRTGNTSAFGTVVSYGGQDDLGFNSSVNSAYAYAGGGVLSISATDSVFHAMQALFPTSGTGTIYVDGASNAGSVGTTAPGGAPTTLGDGIGGFLTGTFCEAGTIPSDASANFSSLNGNQHTFWGF